MSAKVLFPRASAQQRQAFSSHVHEHSSPMQVGLRRGAQQDLAQGRPSPKVTRWWYYQAPRKQLMARRHRTGPVGLPQLAAAATAGGSGNSGGSGTGGGGSGGGGGGNGGRGGSGMGGDHPMQRLTLIFSFLLFAGGLAGYFKRGSTKSLMASTAVATLLLITTTLTGHLIGTWLALGTTTLLGGYMGLRATRSKSLFPSGLVAALSVAMSAGYVWTLLG